MISGFGGKAFVYFSHERWELGKRSWTVLYFIVIMLLMVIVFLSFFLSSGALRFNEAVGSWTRTRTRTPASWQGWTS